MSGRLYILKPTTPIQKLLIAKICIPMGLLLSVIGWLIVSTSSNSANVIILGALTMLVGALALMRYLFDAAEQRIKARILKS